MIRIRSIFNSFYSDIYFNLEEDREYIVEYIEVRNLNKWDIISISDVVDIPMNEYFNIGIKDITTNQRGIYKSFYFDLESFKRDINIRNILG